MSAPVTVLVVDDDAALRESLVTLLVPPFRVVTAVTGQDAKGLFLREKVDVALIDYVLPDCSGLELLEDLHRARPGLPILLMTGFGSEAVAVTAFRGGVWDYLKKPFTAAEVLERLSRALGRRPTSVPNDFPRATGRPLLDGMAVPHPSIERAMRFVDLNFREHLSLAQVAQEAGMSKYHFCRVFRQQVGLTPGEFVASRRIGHAVELLRDGHRSVTEVCVEIGFKNLTHFGRVFRRLVGQSPSAYRRARS